MKVLIVDDDDIITDALQEALERDSMEVRAAHDAEGFLAVARAWNPDMVLLDIEMPGSMTGLDALRMLRRESNVPVLLITGRAGDADKALGLEYADDYMVKPVSIVELRARIRAVLRRTSQQAGEKEERRVLYVGDLMVDLDAHEASFAGRALTLTATEFKILSVLAGSAGRVYPRDELIERVWGPGTYIDPHALDVHIGSLRRKLEPDPSCPAHLQTLRGVGFRYVA